MLVKLLYGASVEKNISNIVIEYFRWILYMIIMSIMGSQEDTENIYIYEIDTLFMAIE